jgi:hypothetical protein
VTKVKELKSAYVLCFNVLMFDLVVPLLHIHVAIIDLLFCCLIFLQEYKVKKDTTATTVLKACKESEVVSVICHQASRC